MTHVTFGLCILLCIHSCCYVQSAVTTCRYLGKTYHLGDTWVDSGACGSCVCNQYGAQCNSDVDPSVCPLKGRQVTPGDPACQYGMNVTLVGDVWLTLDGCNKCLCTERGMQCTSRSCSNGFAQPSTKELYGDCMDNSGWYPLGSHWLSDDGCNTCYCYLPGNYRGMHVCTTNTCGKCRDQIVG